MTSSPFTLTVIIGLSCLLTALVKADGRHLYGHYTNDFVVEMSSGVDELAELVAEAHGFTVDTRLRSLGDNLYHFVHSEVSTRSRRSAHSLLQRLQNDPNVKMVDQQKVLHRVKREAKSIHIIHDKQLELPEPDKYKNKSFYKRFKSSKIRQHKKTLEQNDEHIYFDDTYYKDQWYLVNTGQTGGPSGYDVNVERVWKKNITGQGVVVCILDDGIDHTHPDLSPNYDPEASWDFNDKNDKAHDPTPDKTDNLNAHGTRCAGEVAAVANNSNCIVGIAYNAKIGGVRMLDGTVTDMVEARSLAFNNQHVDIYSSSWGPADDGKTMVEPGIHAQKAFEKGVKEGRQGKGSIFVWATGNGGGFHDDCSCDGYVARTESISIGCINYMGLSTYFTEICPSTMAVIFTGGENQSPTYQEDQSGEQPHLKVATTDLDGGCTLSFEGTSSASPLAAGGFALVLQANPELTWRDLQQLIVETARIPNSNEDGWKKNGADFHINPRFGFGALDIGMMVERAQNWELIGPQIQCEIPSNNKQVHFSVGHSAIQTLQVNNNKCLDLGYTLEHVRMHLVLTHPCRGNVTISLLSPMGTDTVILKPRVLDVVSDGIDFTFMSVHTWGENPIGEWTLNVSDSSTNLKSEGLLKSWSLKLFGKIDLNQDRKDKVNKHSSISAQQSDAHKLGDNEVKSVISKEAKTSDNAKIAGDSNVPTYTEKSHAEGGEYKKRNMQFANSAKEGKLITKEAVKDNTLYRMEKLLNDYEDLKKRKRKMKIRNEIKKLLHDLEIQNQ